MNMKQEKLKIAAVIPTFNRKEFLMDCIQAILNQTYPVTSIYVIDNNSSDGTDQLIKERGFIGDVNGVQIYYHKLSVNGGGAMGFSMGMEKAYSQNHDGYWMMDDDGLPHKDCLKNLCKYINDYDYVCPIVYARGKDESLVAPIDGSINPCKIKEKYGEGEVVEGYTNPFNGGLFSHRLVTKVGFPKKELFIYGDEMNYHQRCLDLGFIPHAITTAIHYHPQFDVSNHISFTHTVNFYPSKLSMYCQWRNVVYNKKIKMHEGVVKKWIKIIYYLFIHIIFFVVKKPSFMWMKLFLRAYFDAILGVWDGQYRFVKKS